MGFAVLHLDKVQGNDAAMSAHIERTIDPKNADKNRTHLNRELLTFPDEIANRTEAIQHSFPDRAIITFHHISSTAVRIISNPDITVTLTYPSDLKPAASSQLPQRRRQGTILRELFQPDSLR